MLTLFIYQLPFFHVEGINKIIMGRTSSLPMSISAERTSFDKTDRWLKFSTGPTRESPGPTLLIQVTTDVNVVVKSRLLRETNKIDIPIISIYTTKYTQVAETVSFSITVLSRRIDFTRLGLSARLNSRMLDLKRIIILPTFKPPPVEPAQAPINISVIIMHCESAGHWLKSAVTNPVVVMMEATWKTACLKETLKDLTIGVMFNAIIHVETATIPRYVQSSSLLKARLNCLIKTR